MRRKPGENPAQERCCIDGAVFQEMVFDQARSLEKSGKAKNLHGCLSQNTFVLYMYLLRKEIIKYTLRNQEAELRTDGNRI